MRYVKGSQVPWRVECRVSRSYVEDLEYLLSHVARTMIVIAV